MTVHLAIYDPLIDLRLGGTDNDILLMDFKDRDKNTVLFSLNLCCSPLSDVQRTLLELRAQIESLLHQVIERQVLPEDSE